MSAASIFTSESKQHHIGFNVSNMQLLCPSFTFEHTNFLLKSNVWSGAIITATSTHFDTNRHATFHRYLQKHLLHIRQNNRYRLKLLIER
jgi:hypothetical protein